MDAVDAVDAEPTLDDEISAAIERLHQARDEIRRALNGRAPYGQAPYGRAPYRRALYGAAPTEPAEPPTADGPSPASG